MSDPFSDDSRPPMDNEILDELLEQAFTSDLPTAHTVIERLRAHAGDLSSVALTPSARRMPEPDLQELGTSRYEVVALLGEGGMGRVLRARDVDLGREVALKVLHEDRLASGEALQRFIEEAQIGGQLQHPGILPVHELGMNRAGRPFIAMKLIEGRTLAALLSERSNARAGRPRLVGIFEQICQAVAFAHSRGVAHRDLKPSNVMVGAFGEVQVMDWGLAKVVHGRGATARGERAGDVTTVRSQGGEAESTTGTVIGTPAYMAPEQARGEIEWVDVRSDVFSLGSILCEILTGTPAYAADSATALRKLARAADLDDALERLERCGADRELVEITRECLSAEADQRPRNAGALAEQIADYLASIDARAERAMVETAEARGRAAQERRARKLTVALAASLLALVLIGGGAYSWIDAEARAHVRQASSKIHAALADAALARGRGAFVEAQAAIRRAGDAMVEGVGEELAHRVSAARQRVVAEASEARAAEELRQDTAALLHALDEVRQPEGDAHYPTQWADVVRQYEQILARHHLPTEAEALAAEARRRGVEARLAAALDRYAHACRHADQTERWEELTRLARDIDPDAQRSMLREAIPAGDKEKFLAAAADPNLLDWPEDTQLLLAQLLAGYEETERACAVVEGVVHRYPGSFYAHLLLARLCIDFDPPRVAAAEVHLTAALALRPHSLEAAHELGRLLDQEAGEPERAARLLRAAVRRHPEDGHLWWHLARSLRPAGDYPAAIDAYRKSLELGLPTASIHVDIAECLRHMGDLTQAAAALERALEIDASDADAWVRHGAVLRGLGQSQAAVDSVRQALAISEDDASAHSMLAVILVDLGELDAALAAARAAVEADPGSAQAHGNLGIVLSKQGQLGAALTALRKALELEPDDALTHYNIGHLLAATGDSDGAIDAYRRSLQLDPSNRTHVNLGDLLQKAGDLEGATREFRRAIVLDPKDPKAYLNLGDTLALKAELEPAIAAYRQSIAADADYASAHTALGLALDRQGKSEEAVATLRRAVAVDPRHVSALVNLGNVLHSHGDFAGAVASHERALEIRPGHPGILYNLGNALRDMGRLEEAIEHFGAAVAGNPRFAQAHTNLGNLLIDVGDLVRAAKHLRRATKADPGLAIAHRELGRAYRLQGQYEDSVSCYERAIELEPNNATPHRALGLTLAEKGDLPGAARAYRRAIAVDPDDLEAVHDLGVTLMRTGDPSEAIGAFERFVSRNPDDFLAHLNLGLAREAAGAPEEAVAAWRNTVEVARRRFSETPAMAADLDERYRYHAAVAAVQVGCRRADRPSPSAEECHRYRAQALEWLRADLALYQEMIDHGRRGVALQHLTSWQTDENLLPVRAGGGFDRVPADEREGWQALWKQVATLRERAVLPSNRGR